MLGFETPRERVKGVFAKDIRERLCRIHDGKLSDADRQAISETRKVLSKHSVEWKS